MAGAHAGATRATAVENHLAPMGRLQPADLGFSSGFGRSCTDLTPMRHRLTYTGAAVLNPRVDVKFAAPPTGFARALKTRII
eukprot:1392634-Prymnesium_polylepis.1